MKIGKAMIKVFILFIILCLCETNSLISHEKEKQALLSFKHALTDPTNRLSSWSSNAVFCGWTGVLCDNVSGRVVGIHLGNGNDPDATRPYGILGGEISPALLDLQFLKHLDLSYNDFGGKPIPGFLGSIRSLALLDLFNASFGGMIPPQLGNLSSLKYLALGCDAVSCELYVEKFSWISLLSSLETLILQGIDLHKEVHWLEYVSILPLLSTLYMAHCQLDNMSPSLKYANFSSLSYLYLPFNNFDHELPNWLFNHSRNLIYLDLSSNSLQGQIPITISNLHNLVYLHFSENRLKGQVPESLGQPKYLMELDLSFNSLDGQVPSSIGNLSSLSTLYLHGNQLNGTLPESMGLLSNLECLDIGRNPLSGIVSEVHFKKLSYLKRLEMSHTHLTFNVSSSWIPPFQLQHLVLTSCKMGPKFPAWLQTQKSLRSLLLSNSGIVDTAPSWLWKWASQIPLILDLSENWMTGDLSKVLLNNKIVDLSSNQFTGHLPRLSKNVIELNIANNPFPRHISSFLCRKVNGGSQLEVLNLSNNSLYGKLSNCLMYWSSLIHLNIKGNNLSGTIPDSICPSIAIQELHFSNNNLFGVIPASLQNCTSLSLLDFAENELSGNIPSWIGEMSNLMVLSLRSNKLIGNIPPQICQLSSLIALDLSNNALSGAIPGCIGNFSRLAKIDTALEETLKNALSYFDYAKFDGLSLVTKGRKSEYFSILVLVRIIDFSSNNLSGSIPSEFSSLSGLQFLNLSQNHLTGRIPERVGSMKSLESMDLSRNHLSGAIPESIASLSFLDQLDLSYNNLSGRIPSSTQLQSFDAVSFIGNAELCGAPLTVNCRKKEDLEGMNSIEESREDFEMTWFYMGMTSGFILSFWGVCGFLTLKREWRYAYFRFP